jgi:hypothetical protein
MIGVIHQIRTIETTNKAKMMKTRKLIIPEDDMIDVIGLGEQVEECIK